MRSLPKKTDRTPTEIQLLQREKFTFVTNFLTPLAPVIGKLFGQSSGELTRRNQAMSYHMKEAVAYNAPNFEMLYNKVQISKGDLIGLQNPTVESTAANTIAFSWEDNSGEGEALAADILVVVLYAPSTEQYFYSLNAADRSESTVTITIPTSFSGVEVQSWITVTRADAKKYATSVYLGATVVS
ncbi:DUF6266 family protein [Flavobacterium sp. 25HG05S-40]|uniref:DUF6266 family protein n=1 Tax=Flavobacterium sp. 25HG05S-40 TaxID=3458682 RepID=UPI004043DD1C